jgi:xylulokinase
MTSKGVAIGIDLGTSSVKAAALSSDGTVLARAKRGYATHRPQPGAAEQLPGDWISAIIGALKELGTTVLPARWEVIGLSGMLPTLVALDENHQPLGVAITWEDGRAEAEADAFRHGQEPGLYERTGQRVDGRYLLPMFARLGRDEPEQAARTSVIAGAKDYLFRVLTGQLLTDPSTASGYGCFNLLTSQWEAVSGETPGLPEVAASTTTRPLASGFAGIVGARPGIPVVLGAADSVLGAYGLGADTPGDVAYIAGTSTVILGSTERFTPDLQQRYLVTPLAEAGFGAEMDLLSTGSAIDWLARLVGASDAGSLVDAASSVAPDSAPTFLPYLAPGEQGALWSSSLRGTLFGLTLGSTGPEIARGLLNGILLESRRCVRVLDEVDGAGGRLLVTGSSAAAPSFRQDLADATGRVVYFSPGETDHSVLGAAVFAGRAVDLMSGSPTSELARTDPSPERAGLWDELAERHDERRLALKADA